MCPKRAFALSLAISSLVASCGPPAVSDLGELHEEDGIAQLSYSSEALSTLVLADGLATGAFQLRDLAPSTSFTRVGVRWDADTAGGMTSVQVRVRGGDQWMTVVVDSQYVNAPGKRSPDLACCSVGDDRSLWGQDVLLEHISDEHDKPGITAHGRWIGMLRTRARGREWLELALDALLRSPDFAQLSMGDLLNHIVAQGHPVRVIYIHGHWLDVNSLRDLEQAGHFTAGQR